MRRAGYTRQTQKPFWRRGATVSGREHNALWPVTKRAEMDCSLVETLGSRMRWVILLITGVQGPRKRVASDETVQEGVLVRQSGDGLQVNLDPERLRY